MQHRVAPRSAQSRKVASRNRTKPIRKVRQMNSPAMRRTAGSKDCRTRILNTPSYAAEWVESAALLIPEPSLTNGPISLHLSFGVAVSYRADQPADGVAGRRARI